MDEFVYVYIKVFIKLTVIRILLESSWPQNFTFPGEPARERENMGQITG